MGISIKVLAITVAVGGVAVVGSTIASSSIVSPVARISDVGAPENATSSFTEATVSSFTKAAVMTRADFDQEFTDVAAMPRPGNTPGNRERLRDAGWKLIGASR